MPPIAAAVYQPMRPDLPFVAVVFHKGEVLMARVVPDPATGEAFLAQVMMSITAELENTKKH